MTTNVVAAGAVFFGLLLAIGSFVYGAKAPTAGEKPEQAKQRIETATIRHAHVVDVERAERRGNEAKKAEARAKLAEIQRQNNELIEAREKAVARHGMITGILRYSGCFCMLGGVLTLYAKAQNSD